MISIVALKLRLIYLNVDKSLYLINNKYFKYQIMIIKVAAKILLEKNTTDNWNDSFKIVLSDRIKIVFGILKFTLTHL